MDSKLDSIDRKIIYELDINSNIPVTQLAKKLKVSKDRVNYRIEKLTRENIINKFVTQIDPTKIGYLFYRMFFKFQNLTKEKEKEIINWIMKSEYVNWASSCKGRWELNITLFAKNINEFDKVISEFFKKFGKYVLEQEFNITLKIGILNKENILLESKDLKREIKYFGINPQEVKLDKIDIAILKNIANNSRINYAEIAERLKTTPRIVIYRVKELEKKGIILGYSESLNYEKLKKQFFKANIYFNYLDEDTRKRIEEYCVNRPNIIYFIFCLGSWPLEIEMLVDDNKQFYEEMDKFRENFPEMKNYDTILFSGEHKFTWMPECYKPEK